MLYKEEIREVLHKLWKQDGEEDSEVYNKALQDAQTAIEAMQDDYPSSNYMGTCWDDGNF